MISHDCRTLLISTMLSKLAGCTDLHLCVFVLICKILSIIILLRILLLCRSPLIFLVIYLSGKTLPSYFGSASSQCDTYFDRNFRLVLGLHSSSLSRSLIVRVCEYRMQRHAASRAAAERRRDDASCILDHVCPRIYLSHFLTCAFPVGSGKINK